MDITNNKPINIQKRIGSTVYVVNAYLNQNTKETMNDKILRLIKNDLNLAVNTDRVDLPQTSRLPERSSA